MAQIIRCSRTLRGAVRLGLVVIMTLALHAAGQELFRDLAAPMDALGRDLIARLTLDEKANLMKN